MDHGFVTLGGCMIHTLHDEMEEVKCKHCSKCICHCQQLYKQGRFGILLLVHRGFKCVSLGHYLCHVAWFLYKVDH